MSSYQNTELTDSIIYFTYGSNMNNQTQKWRQINYSRKFNAILENYKLLFDLEGYELVEGGFANVMEEKGHSIHGIAMEMTKQDFIKKIKETEGPQYLIKDIDIISYEDNKVYKAITLSAKTDGKYRYPSKRYLDLIVNGAKENKLDENYIKYLEEFPDAYNSLNFLGKFIRFFFLLNYTPFFILFFLIRKLSRFISPSKFHGIYPILKTALRFIPGLVLKYVAKNAIFKKRDKSPEEIEFLIRETRK